MNGRQPAARSLPAGVTRMTIAGAALFVGGLTAYFLGKLAPPASWQALPLLAAATGAFLVGVAHRRIGPRVLD